MLKQKIVLKNNKEVITVDRSNYNKTVNGNFSLARMKKYFRGMNFFEIFDYACSIEKGTISNDELKKKFGVTSREVELLKLYILHCVYTTYRSVSLHKCWNACSNGFPSKCGKVLDLDKKNIADYPYVTKGFQVYSDVDMERFVVFECAHYCDNLDKAPDSNLYLYDDGKGVRSHGTGNDFEAEFAERQRFLSRLRKKDR